MVETYKKLEDCLIIIWKSYHIALRILMNKRERKLAFDIKTEGRLNPKPIVNRQDDGGRI